MAYPGYSFNHLCSVNWWGRLQDLVIEGFSGLARLTFGRSRRNASGCWFYCQVLIWGDINLGRKVWLWDLVRLGLGVRYFLVLWLLLFYRLFVQFSLVFVNKILVFFLQYNRFLPMGGPDLFQLELSIYGKMLHVYVWIMFSLAALHFRNLFSFFGNHWV